MSEILKDNNDEKAHIATHENQDGLPREDDDTEASGIDHKHEKRVLRKMDFHLLPFVSLLYLLSFL